jgi:hypothetical protein
VNSYIGGDDSFTLNQHGELASQKLLIIASSASSFAFLPAKPVCFSLCDGAAIMSISFCLDAVKVFLQSLNRLPQHLTHGR